MNHWSRPTPGFGGHSISSGYYRRSVQVEPETRCGRHCCCESNFRMLLYVLMGSAVAVIVIIVVLLTVFFVEPAEGPSNNATVKHPTSGLQIEKIVDDNVVLPVVQSPLPAKILVRKTTPEAARTTTEVTTAPTTDQPRTEPPPEVTVQPEVSEQDYESFGEAVPVGDSHENSQSEDGDFVDIKTTEPAKMTTTVSATTAPADHYTSQEWSAVTSDPISTISPVVIDYAEGSSMTAPSVVKTPVSTQPSTSDLFTRTQDLVPLEELFLALSELGDSGKKSMSELDHRMTTAPAEVGDQPEVVIQPEVAPFVPMTPSGAADAVHPTVMPVAQEVTTVQPNLQSFENVALDNTGWNPLPDDTFYAWLSGSGAVTKLTDRLTTEAQKATVATTAAWTEQVTDVPTVYTGAEVLLGLTQPPVSRITLADHILSEFIELTNPKIYGAGSPHRSGTVDRSETPPGDRSKPERQGLLETESHAGHPTGQLNPERQGGLHGQSNTEGQGGLNGQPNSDRQEGLDDQSNPEEQGSLNGQSNPEGQEIPQGDNVNGQLVTGGHGALPAGQTSPGRLGTLIGKPEPEGPETPHYGQSSAELHNDGRLPGDEPLELTTKSFLESLFDNFERIPVAPDEVSESESAPGADDSRAKPAAGADDSRARPAAGADDSRATPAAGADDSRAKPAAGADNSRAKPAAGADDSRTKPAAGADDSRVKPAAGHGWHTTATPSSSIPLASTVSLSSLVTEMEEDTKIERMPIQSAPEQVNVPEKVTAGHQGGGSDTALNISFDEVSERIVEDSVGIRSTTAAVIPGDSRDASRNDGGSGLEEDTPGGSAKPVAGAPHERLQDGGSAKPADEMPSNGDGPQDDALVDGNLRDGVASKETQDTDGSKTPQDGIAEEPPNNPLDGTPAGNGHKPVAEAPLRNPPDGAAIKAAAKPPGGAPIDSDFSNYNRGDSPMKKTPSRDQPGGAPPEVGPVDAAHPKHPQEVASIMSPQDGAPTPAKRQPDTTHRSDADDGLSKTATDGAPIVVSESRSTTEQWPLAASHFGGLPVSGVGTAQEVLLTADEEHGHLGEAVLTVAVGNLKVGESSVAPGSTVAPPAAADAQQGSGVASATLDIAQSSHFPPSRAPEVTSRAPEVTSRAPEVTSRATEVTSRATEVTSRATEGTSTQVAPPLANTEDAAALHATVESLSATSPKVSPTTTDTHRKSSAVGSGHDVGDERSPEVRENTRRLI